MSARCLVVGWDGADRATVEAMLAAGELPVLGQLVRRGRMQAIEALPGLGDDGHWASFATGLRPGRHARFHYQQIRPGTADFQRVRREMTAAQPFWEPLIREGRSVAVVDMPKSPTAAPVPGAHARELVDWMPHGEDGDVASGYPDDVIDHMRAHYPQIGFAECHRVIVDEAELGQLLQVTLARIDTRIRLLAEWADESDWDLLMTVFAESHCVGHHGWHLHDPSHPRHPEDSSGSDPVRDCYRTLDRALGQLVEMAGPTANVVVFSLLGMGPDAGSSNAPIRALELVCDLERGGPDGMPHVRGQLSTAWAGRVDWRRMLRRATARTQSQTSSEDRPSARRAFVVPFESAGAIRLNVVGREPHGQVLPGDDYDRTCDRLEAALLALVDVQSGRPVVRSVVRTARTYPGVHSAALADLLVIWEPLPVGSVTSEHVGTVTGEASGSRSGDHVPGGWLVTTGSADAPDTAQTVGAWNSGGHPTATLPIEDIGGLITSLVRESARSQHPIA